MKTIKPLTLKISELAYLFFVLYVVVKNMAINIFDISSINYLLLFVSLYFGFKLFFYINKKLSLTILLLITILSLAAYLGFAIYFCSFQYEIDINFFIPNKSIFSILLASQIVFVFPIWLSCSREKILSKFPKFFFISLIIASLLLLVLTKGRASYIGLVLAFSYIVYQYLSFSTFKRIFLYISFPAFVLLTTVMFSYKSDSSSGRLLIYKISAGILKDNWLWGIGQGQFKVQYNHYQGEYFASHSIDSKEALLADNSFYAFNDFFQTLIENGLIAFLFLAVIIFLLIMQINKAKINTANKHLFIASVASLLCILTSSLFSYSLQIFPIAVQAILCLSIINSFQSDRKFQIELSKTGSKIAKGIFLLISTLLLVHFCVYFNYKRESNQAFELKRSGFRQKTIEKYKKLSNSYIQEGSTLYLYAQELYYTNQLTLAQKALGRAKKFYCTNEVYKLSAAIESELQNYVQAETDYKKAIYMVPNRMISRSELFQYYLERKDTINAIYWANSILNMPVKVPSQKTKSIQLRTEEMLLQLNK